MSTGLTPPEAIPSPEVGAVVFDLDGVIRQWNDDELAEVEVAHGLAPREILDVAFSEHLGPAAITGAMNYREWMDAIRAEVVGRHGTAVIPALDVWEANVGVVDPEMVQLVRTTRTQVKVALLSNGTTRLRRDLHVLDLLDEFDLICNTAEMGVAKPDAGAFLSTCEALSMDPSEVAFIDDLEPNVAGAAEVGLRSHRFVDVHGARRFLTRLGLRTDRARTS
jgi:putative hydrolase of the HAD superfamily